jgi:hypothetical protein
MDAIRKSPTSRKSREVGHPLSTRGALSLRCRCWPPALVELEESAGSSETPLLGTFTIEFAKAVGPSLAAVGVAVAAWLQARYGRKARLKIGDIEAEARSNRPYLAGQEIPPATVTKDGPRLPGTPIIYDRVLFAAVASGPGYNASKAASFASSGVSCHPPTGIHFGSTLSSDL